jgi:hypothetical protein
MRPMGRREGSSEARRCPDRDGPAVVRALLHLRTSPGFPASRLGLIHRNQRRLGLVALALQPLQIDNG